MVSSANRIALASAENMPDWVISPVKANVFE
jgi:hypothetical protein